MLLIRIRRLTILLVLLYLGCAWPVVGQAPPVEMLYAYQALKPMPQLADGASGIPAVEAAIRQRMRYHPTAGTTISPADGGQVTFIIGTNGRVRDARVRSQLGAAYNQALLAAVQSLPGFVPGKVESQLIATYVALNVGYKEPYKAPAPPIKPPKVEALPGWPVFMQQLTQQPYLMDGQRLSQAIERRLLPRPAGKPIPQLRFFFTVNEQGNITNILFPASIGLHYERAVWQALSLLPRLEPGRLGDQPVATLMYETVRFPQNPDDTPPTQPAPLPYDSAQVYTYVERMPALPTLPASVAGTSSMPAPLGQTEAENNLRRHVLAQLAVPPEVRQGKVDGEVTVSVVVGPSGAHYQHQVLKSLSPACDAAALAAVTRLPRFMPGQQSGRLVAVNLRIKVPFIGPHHAYHQYEVAQRAVFPGGPDALHQYLYTQQRQVPVIATEKLNGHVTVQFVVAADGRVLSPQVLRGFCTSCDQEAIRLIQAMPVWTPARTAQGQAVAVLEQVEFAMPAPAERR